MIDKNAKLLLKEKIVDKQEFKEKFRIRLKNFVVDLLGLVNGMPKDEEGRIIANQVLRSGTSIGANYYEARSSSSKNDFIRFFSYALKSANETQFWLEIIIDIRKSNYSTCQNLLNELMEISNILATSLLTLKGKK